MITLNISLKGKETIVQLFYKKWDDAEKAHTEINIPSQTATIRDDYGQFLRVSTPEIAASVVTDMHRYFEAQTEIGVMQQKAQQSAQQQLAGPGAIMMPRNRPSFNG